MNDNDVKFDVSGAGGGENGDSNDVLTSAVLHGGTGNNGTPPPTTGLAVTATDENFNLSQLLSNTSHHHSHHNHHHLNGSANPISDDEEVPHVLRDQDRFLPIANVAKLMKKAIPERGKIAKEAKECVQECVSEFISFITSEAAERCSQERRKTINGEDLLYAMSQLGFDNYVEPLKLYLQKYRESVKSDAVAAAASGAATSN